MDPVTGAIVASAVSSMLSPKEKPLWTPPQFGRGGGTQMQSMQFQQHPSSNMLGMLANPLMEAFLKQKKKPATPAVSQTPGSFALSFGYPR